MEDERYTLYILFVCRKTCCCVVVYSSYYYIVRSSICASLDDCTIKGRLKQVMRSESSERITKLPKLFEENK